ncbi:MULTISPECIES: hypothetical protein [unclassified Streptomyces]|uniref:hypothetical protein n=1 Tax=unclassified Streptomyces TaxID=2593676 RepID=UPI003D92C13B
MTLAASSWWADWPKFVPGWLAFVWTLGAGARRVWVRRNRVALGPADDELREALTGIRTLFEVITTPGGRRADWFMAEERRETAHRIQDLAERREDSALRGLLAKVTPAWDEAFAAARPTRLIDGVLDPNAVPDSRKNLEDDRRFAQQVKSAHAGLIHARESLDRLNELERKTHGR